MRDLNGARHWPNLSGLLSQNWTEGGGRGAIALVVSGDTLFKALRSITQLRSARLETGSVR